MTRKFLIAYFVFVLLAMAWATVRASLDRNVFAAVAELIHDPWVVATLFDAYFGFLTFYLWVLYKERRWWPRLGWFVAIMALGNFAMATYALRELLRLTPGEPVSQLLTRRYS